MSVPAPEEAPSGPVLAGQPLEFVGLDTPPPEPSSEAVRLFSAIGTPKGRDGAARGPRFLGLPLPAWVLVAGVCVAALIGALVILPRVSPTRPPAESAIDDDAGTIGIGPVPSGGAGVTSPGSAGGGPSLPSAGASGDAVPATAPLKISQLTATNRVLGWRVSITIANPAGIAQDWHNVSVQVEQGVPLVLDAITPGTRVRDAGRTVCVEPTGPSAIPPGGATVIEFDINVLLANPPQKSDAHLDNPVCSSADG